MGGLINLNSFATILSYPAFLARSLVRMDSSYALLVCSATGVSKWCLPMGIINSSALEVATIFSVIFLQHDKNTYLELENWQMY